MANASYLPVNHENGCRGKSPSVLTWSAGSFDLVSSVALGPLCRMSFVALIISPKISKDPRPKQLQTLLSESITRPRAAHE